MDEKFKAFMAPIVQKLKDIWNTSRIVILAILGVFAIFKFRGVMADLIVSGGKAAVDEATKKDEVLAKEETSANASADALVTKAKEEPLKEVPIGTDWNVKK